MKYPSVMLQDLSERLDPIEDKALEHYAVAREWLSGFKVWRWHEQARRIEALERKNSLLVEGLKECRAAYRGETGKVPPGATALTLGDDQMVRRFMQSLSEMGEVYRRFARGRAS